MSQQIETKIKGLYSNNNILSEVPDGALSKALNVVIDKDSVAEPRRGFEAITTLPDVLHRADSATSFQDKVIIHRQNDNKLSRYDGASTWTDFTGSYLHPDSNLARLRFQEMNGNLYFTSSDGIKVLDAYNNPVYSTGMPPGLDGSGVTTSASGFLTNLYYVAYRVVWGSKDANNNLYLGSPSQRIIVYNSSGATRDVSLTFTIPDGLSTSDFFEVYRSPQSAAEPNDDLQLIYSNNPTAGEITAKSVTFTDATPDSLRGAFLYSNANQEGIQEANSIPPFANDICPFKNFMFYAGIKTKHQLNISLLAVSGSLGLIVNDTITINAMVFTGKAATTIASKEFKVSTAGSASQNIDDTARELVKVINQYTSNTTIYAYYVTAYNDLPGQILLESRVLSDTSFSVSVSRTTAWKLNNGVSTNSNYPHGLMWSKIQQPEHVPAVHLQLVGNKASYIRRILALRDSLFILKDDGVWRLTGINGSWNIEPLDTSTKILSPESAVVLNNQIFALTDQGIVTISDLGVAVISRPIEDKINEITSFNLDKVKNVSFGVGYETEHKYILSTITSTADTYSTQQFVYNTFTKAWTQWEKPALCGFVNKTDNKLYLAKPDESYILKERKSNTYRDFIDEELFGYSVVSSTGYTVVLNIISGLSVGDLIYSSATNYSPITEINSSTNTITLNDAKTWSVGSIQVFKAIDCQLEFVNQDCGNPGIDKHFQEVAFLFRQQQFNIAAASFYTDLSGGYESSSILGNYGGGTWGTFSWGDVPWGGIQRPKPIRVFIPREKSRGSLLSIKYNHRVGFGRWSLNGYSLHYDFVSERLGQ